MKQLFFLTLCFSLGLCTTNQTEENPINQTDSIKESPSFVANALAPTDGKALALTANLENPYYLIGDDGYVYLYVNVKGALAKSDTKRTPLNISLVVDRSGSMGSENKLKFVKKACEIVIDNLAQEDYLSLVAYDDHVNAVQRSKSIKAKNIWHRKVKEISPGGSTNLSGGMLEGFSQVKSTFQDKYVNRILLLSDGLANVGVTNVNELEKIVQRKFEKENIAISTFGVGVDFNEDLMTNLAENGKGNYYFIESADAIPNIFKKELEGLLSVVAQNTRLHIEFPSDIFEVSQVYGYDYKVTGNTVNINYNDVFSNEEKAVLIRLSKKKSFEGKQDFNIQLTYDDVLNDYSRETATTHLTLQTTSDKVLYEKSRNEEVTKNKVLFISNYEYQLATQEVDKGNYEAARDILIRNDAYLHSNMKYVEQDTILRKQFESNKDYEKDLDNMKSKSQQERRRIQKYNKSKSYNFKKKKRG